MKKAEILFLLIMLFTVFALNACGKVDTTTPSEALTNPLVTSTIAPQDTLKSPETTEQAPVVHTISPEDAKEMMEHQDVIVVDVRREDEYAEGHIPGAILLPNETIAEEAEMTLTDKNATILIYCRSGRRSAEAAQKLIDLGYRNVYDFGGILDWKYEITTE